MYSSTQQKSIPSASVGGIPQSTEHNFLGEMKIPWTLVWTRRQPHSQQLLLS